MRSSNAIIKIKIEDHSYTEEDLQNMDQWENEGGSPFNRKVSDLSLKLPVKPGQIFEVLNGDLIYEEGKLYYTVELNILALH